MSKSRCSISKDENLTKAHVRYLESRLIQTISQANRVNLSNGTVPDVPLLPEPDIADMEYFLTQVQILLPVLGFSFASPLPTVTQRKEMIQEDIQQEPPSIVFQLTYAGVLAFAQEVNNEFVVLKGSTARKKEVNSLSDPYIQIRKQLYAEGKLADGDDSNYWVFTQDIPFLTSPKRAAFPPCRFLSFVLYRLIAFCATMVERIIPALWSRLCMSAF